MCPTPAPNGRQNLDWTELLTALQEILDRDCSLRLYSGPHCLLTADGAFTGTLEPFHCPEAPIFLEIAEALVTVIPEQVRSIKTWVESFGEPAPRVLIELVTEHASIEIEAPPALAAERLFDA